MSDTVIKVEGLGKRYIIGHRARGGGAQYKRFSEALMNATRAPFQRVLKYAGIKQPTQEEFWALKDVAFEVKRGDVLGVIGRNGAGKSTLLKLLSRITEPTEGRVVIDGRVAALLEVGTGFHPELTGRENIFLNGAILGMGRVEIKKKFDEIVAFAETEKFLDTPVKHYSSGMYVRLAFAVAAHLEPEILIVDEVLAVGDTLFQKKCLGKMQDVASRDGRTVLFVSHNMGAVTTLCSRVILMQKGKIAIEGTSDEVIEMYLSAGAQTTGETVWPDAKTAPGNEKIRLQAVRLVSEGKVTANVAIDQELRIEMDYFNLQPGLPICASLHLLDKTGQEILATANWSSANVGVDEWFGRGFPAGLFRTSCTIPANFLNEGHYSFRIYLLSSVSKVEFSVKEPFSFLVHETGAMRVEYAGTWIGMIRPKLAWQTGMLHHQTTTNP